MVERQVSYKICKSDDVGKLSLKI